MCDRQFGALNTPAGDEALEEIVVKGRKTAC
jgi:hypothetical protein